MRDCVVRMRKKTAWPSNDLRTHFQETNAADIKCGQKRGEGLKCGVNDDWLVFCIEPDSADDSLTQER